MIENVQANDLYEAYRDIQKEYEQRAFKSNNWKLLNEKEGVEVSLLEHPDDPLCPYVKMKAVLPVPVKDCWDFLRVSNWGTSMPKMDPFYEGVTVNGEFSHNKVSMILCRKRMKRILAFGKRDLVFLSCTEDDTLEDGTWVSGTVSVRTPTIPRCEGYTRAFQDSIAFYKPLQDNTKCEVTIVCRMDLNDSGTEGSGGSIPMWLYVKTIGRTGCVSILRMRDALIENQQERE
jgi:hypothetical protein